MVAWAKIKRRLGKFKWWLLPITYVLILTIIILLLKAGLVFVQPGLKWLDPAININSYRGRTNLLLLGVGGEGHEGADLTDSMMLISVDLVTADTVMVSLPRDVWVESLRAKLNSAYHYGEAKQPGGGLVLAKAAVSEIINQPVHHGLILDFSGFEQAVDIVGGIDIDVPRAFTDDRYPIPGQEAAVPESARYETVIFNSGPQHFNGALALKYVRSRHNEGEEGTDFARAQRQQRIILAFKEKLLLPKVWFNLTTIKQLRAVAAKSLKTDLPAEVYPDALKLALKIDRDQIRTGVLDQGSSNEDIPPLLYNPPVAKYGQWVLLPTGDNWDNVYRFFEEILYQNQGLKTKQ